MMGKNIAVVLTDYFEDSEYTEPAKAFKEAGHELTVIENEKGKTVKGKQGNAEVTVDASIDDVNPSDFDALLIPGGFSPDQLRADDRFVQFTKAFMTDKNQYSPFATARALNQRESARWPKSNRLYVHSC